MKDESVDDLFGAESMMWSNTELEALARDLESDRVERKESFAGSAREKIAQAVCAFANDLPGSGLPGVVMVGLRDDGTPTGLAITDELLQNLGAIRSDGKVLPLPVMVVERRTLGGAAVAVVTVHPSGDPPVRYDGRVWIRVGPRRGIASRDEERILTERRRSGDREHDRGPVRGATLDELDLDAFTSTYLPAAFARDVLETNDRSTADRLRALHLLAPTGEPTIGAVLLLGRDPGAWLPGAYVQFLRVQGRELGDPVADQKVLSGPVPHILRQASDLVSLGIRTPLSLGTGPTDVRQPDYPHEAVMQLLANALMHRTYESNAPVRLTWFDDRIEIASPGGPYGCVTPETFGEPYATDYRNPLLAEGLKLLGFVQRFGMGIAIARRSCLQNGNPPPAFDVGRGHVLATLRPRP